METERKFFRSRLPFTLCRHDSAGKIVYNGVKDFADRSFIDRRMDMRLEHMTWKQAQAYFAEHDTVVIPVGSIENHGSHLALGTDFLVPSHIAQTIDQQTDVLIAPAVPYGVADHHFGFPGTVSLGYDGLKMVIERIVGCLYGYGTRKFIFLNGHGGNDNALLDVGLELEDMGALSALVNWWQLAGELNPKWKGGHGGGEETAAILAINPDWVHMEDYMPLTPVDLSENLKVSGMKTVAFKGANVTVQRRFQSVTPSGWYGPDDPRDATAEWGKEMLETVSQYIVEFIREFQQIQLPDRG